MKKQFDDFLLSTTIEKYNSAGFKVINVVTITPHEAWLIESQDVLGTVVISYTLRNISVRKNTDNIKECLRIGAKLILEKYSAISIVSLWHIQSIGETELDRVVNRMNDMLNYTKVISFINREKIEITQSGGLKNVNIKDANPNISRILYVGVSMNFITRVAIETSSLFFSVPPVDLVGDLDTALRMIS